MNKKGDILDILVFLVSLTVLAIGLFVFSFVVPEITDGLTDAGLDNSVEGTFAIESLEQFGVETIQRGFFFVFVGLIMGMMISSFFIRTHPIFIFLYIFFLAVAVFLSVYLGNVYYDLSINPVFTERLADQFYINIVMQNILWIVLGTGALSIIIIFSKFNAVGGGGPI